MNTVKNGKAKANIILAGVAPYIIMNELATFKISKANFAPSVKIGVTSLMSTRYIKPPKVREIPDRLLKYSLAEELARDIMPEQGCRYFVVLDGKFIAGDFFEAFITEHNMHVKRMTISTLSLSENNVDSLANLLDGDYVDELNLIVSDYFYSHERHNLVKYLYSQLDKDDKFQLAAAGTHCKICLIETHCGKFFTIHGSANLRSSGNIEQICIEEGRSLYDFNLEYHLLILEQFKTIKKNLRHDKLWQVVQK